MAVVGIDFGSLHSKIGVARRGGIDIIVNEVSNRATPSLVAFGPKQRVLGEAAKNQETSNFRNTIGSLKRLVGRTLDDPDVQNIEKKFINATLVDVEGTVGVEVNYVGEKQRFSATQLVAAYLGKLRDITANELKNGVTDVVIAVPGWFTDVQRRALLDAAAIAGLNVLRLINDTTAAAFGYGITKTDLPEPESPRHVCFVDVGHSTLTVSVVAFVKGELTVLSSAYDRNCGGRDIDFALVQHFAEEFKGKYKIDVLSQPKAVFRLAAGCEKLKKILSANAESPLNVESIVNDVDATSKLTREELEGLVGGVTDRITAPLERAIADSGITIDQIDAVELIGGSTRMPAVRAKIQAAFPGKVLSTTLNQDEAVARGATFTCASLSPVFKVKDFAMKDITPYAIKAVYNAVPTEPEDTETMVFKAGHPIPSTMALTFPRSEDFQIDAAYAEPSALPGGINPSIASVTVESPGPNPNGEATTPVRLKLRLNAHGIFTFESAYVEVAVEAAAEMEVDPVEGEKEKKKRTKRTVTKRELKFTTQTSSLPLAKIESFREQENAMHAADKLVMDTEDRKNALEEYVYDTRGKLDERYASYVQASEKEALLSALSSAEDWLYTEEGEDAFKSAYVAKLDALKALGDPIAFRFTETDERPRAMSALREALNNYMTQANSGDTAYEHIDAKDKESVVEKCAVAQQWLEDQQARQSEKPKNVNPVLTSADILKKKDEIIYFSAPIMSKPKPKPPVIPSSTNTPKPETPQPEKAEDKPETGPSEMDVD